MMAEKCNLSGSEKKNNLIFNRGRTATVLHGKSQYESRIEESMLKNLST